MRAITVKSPGGPEQLALGEFETPLPDDEELLVKVHAAALNRADLMQREGRYPPPEGASPLLGLEAAGVAASKGRKCVHWDEGDRVFGLLLGGGYAEYAVLHKDMAMAIPPGMTFEEAAAIPEVFLTAYQALHWLGGVQVGRNVLVHAGASGVGTAALQLVREAGARPFATVSEGKIDRTLALGAEEAIDYEHESFDERVLEETDGHGADIIIDFIGAPYLKKNLNALALDGRIVLLATLGGSSLYEFDLRELFRKRARIEASTLRSRSLDYKIRLTREFASALMPSFVDRRLEPVIDRIYEWEDVADAHRHMGANRNVGKIVLKVR